MDNNLGRNKLWTLEIWAEIDRAVKDEVGQLRVAQKVFPASLANGAVTVPDDTIDLVDLRITEGATKPLIEVSVEFSMSRAQADHEATLRTGRTLARFAAKSIALAEDALLFRGDASRLPDGVVLGKNNASTSGLLNLASHTVTIDRKSPEYPESILRELVSGMGHLIGQGQPGPYALVLDPEIYGDVHNPRSETLVTAADRIVPLVPGGFYASGGLTEPGPGAARHGLLVSLGGEPTVIYLGLEATTAFTQVKADGDLLFRVFERVQIVARDPRALVALTFVN